MTNPLNCLTFMFTLLIDTIKLVYRVLPIGRSPFSKQYLSSPPEEIESNSKVRDAVLKQGFHPSKVPEDLDAIVIGSGIGGLSVALLLARLGKRVLVLEQHDQAGGCCHTFVEDGYEFDTGIHYIGRLGDKRLPFRAYIDQLTGAKVDWVQMDDAFDYVVFNEGQGRTDFPMKSGKEAFWQNLFDRFPQSDHEAIAKYRFLTKRIEESRKCLLTFKTLPLTVLKMLKAFGILPKISSYFGAYANKTPFEVIDELGISKELASILVYACNNGGGLPDDLSFSMLALLTSHYERGGFYPKGGSSEIPFHMIPIIEAAGGRVLVRARVSNILLTASNVACGVTVVKGSKSYDIYSPKVISDVGVINTFTKLLPRSLAEQSRYYKYALNGTGQTAMYLFVGMNGSQDELKLPAGNYWIFTQKDCTAALRSFLAKSAEDAAKSPIPGLFVSFPSAKDPTFEKRHPGKSTCLVGALCNYEWFAPYASGKPKHRGAEYESLKMEFGRTMWQQLLQVFPHLDGTEDHFDVGTPLSNNFYINSSRGELYGLHHGLGRFTDEENIELRPETDIPGLYLTGQDVFTCGFAGAVYGGLACAGVVLNRSTFFDLFRYTWQLQRSV